ncbi:hypothetical protein [Seonamhaeicola marinus]|uniref:Uncharacterized protein n=1 Tax=Seonamhaeicola marinus TaxID=1912246 RepID=A0A5D0HN51_9FLAO|nr:hypothetical protein [Seonamhaeicola marinus]TYA71779.1 hypothetical protein FUA24_19700 [Seonamhaeicola marinus]
MKNLRPLLLGAIIGALLTYFFCPRQAVEAEDLSSSMQQKAIVKPEGVITVEQAKALNDNWTKFRKPVLDSVTERRVKKEDYRWAWWSLEDIENYIAYIRSETPQGETFTGLRVYLGVYDENSTNGKNGMTTMFIVPTGGSNVNKGSLFNMTVQGNGDRNDPPLNNSGGSGDGYPQ